MFRYLFLLFFLPFFLNAQTAEFSRAERLQGYKINMDTTCFIFDEQIYQVKPERVILEGAMRNWNHDLNDERWQLKKSTAKDIWILNIVNPGLSVIPPGSEFKFRIDKGKWMDIPADAPNKNSGNLLFAHKLKPLRVEAEIAAPRDIRLIFKSAHPDYLYSPQNYVLTNAQGQRINIERVFYISPDVLQIVPAEDLNIRRLYYLEVKYLNIKMAVSYDGWFRHLYSDKELGANYLKNKDATYIRLFAPRADLIKLYLYKEPAAKAKKIIDMKRDENGVWEARLPGNWEGWYYDFTAHGADEPGNRFYQTNPVQFSDPWGRVSVDTFGPCRIWPKMKPAAPLKNGRPKMEDIIAYEVHVQDFTRNLPLDDQLKGTFAAFSKSDLRNAHGEKIGFDHLVDLGVNVIHLMPVQEYLHFPDEEWREAFLNDPYMIEQGINEENYQWGYRTSHAFAIESRYRVKGSRWGEQNKQFRDLVQAFHDKGIAVIVDLVFNHTAERMDGRQYYFNFSAIDIPYFYRTDEKLDFIGAYGSETKSEERPMMQRWIIEQCTDLIEQYGLDGFRIDLAGQTDEQTLKALREAVGPDIIIYGEPWIASADPDYENNPDWDWYKEDSPITFFQDDGRNAFKGPTSNPQNKLKDRGYAGGNGDRENVKKALAAGFPEDKTPLAGINYLDIHDNWALADRFAATDWDGRFGVDENRYKIAAALLFTSLGPVVIHGGSEMMRSKGLAPLQEIVKHIKSGALYFHGKRDTYNYANANAFIWNNKGKNTDDDPSIKCNYDNMYQFWKGLIALRKSKYGKVFRIAEKPEKDYFQWIEPENSKLLGYIVDKKVFVLINTDQKSGSFKNIVLADGNWRLAATIDSVDYVNGISGQDDSVLKGGKSYDFKLDGESLKIWVNK